jgi:hypothetical protein
MTTPIRNTLAGVEVVLTGKCLNLPRATLALTIAQLSGKHANEVTPGTTGVVVAKGWPQSKWATAKIQDALRHGIPILNDRQLDRVIKGDITLQQAIDARPALPETLDTKDGPMPITWYLAPVPSSAPTKPSLDLANAFLSAPDSPFVLSF